MKYFFLIFILLGCTTKTPQGFNKEAHCSKETRELFTGTVVSAEKLSLSNMGEFRKCYEQTTSPEPKLVCVAIRLDEVGGVSYVDAADEVNGMRPEFRSCLISVLKSLDYQSLKSKNGLDILGPIQFSPGLSN